MVFSSLIFLFAYLPFILLGNWLLGSNIKYKNLFLLVGSLFFYAWGEGEKVLVMIASILLNYFIGKAIERYRVYKKKARSYLFVGIFLNLAVLINYKYAFFFASNLNIILDSVGIPLVEVEQTMLPIGISFYTFQAMSYIIDVYNGKAPVQKRVVDLGLYITLFPQLIAGPIVRYNEIAAQINDRVERLDDVAWGLRRFLVGLAKKVLIANSLGQSVDMVFGMDPNSYGTSTAWVVLLAYTLQLYYDFSGYSDMAIGLGRVFGFKIPENFRFPYSSRSIREFWHRWHITLSNWFRDYLYIPLGGNRISVRRTYFNLIIVFFITGLWHGASWNFIIWGLFHGLFLIIERTKGGKILDRAPALVQRFYMLFVVMIGWMFFRSPDLAYSAEYAINLFSFRQDEFVFLQIMNGKFIIMLVLGSVFSFPVLTSNEGLFFLNPRYRALKDVMLLALFIICIINLVNSTYNPFIYFRF